MREEKKEEEWNEKRCMLRAEQFVQNILHRIVFIPVCINLLCDARRRKSGSFLYSSALGLLAIISRAYPPFLSPAPRNI